MSPERKALSRVIGGVVGVVMGLICATAIYYFGVHQQHLRYDPELSGRITKLSPDKKRSFMLGPDLHYRTARVDITLLDGSKIYYDNVAVPADTKLGQGTRAWMNADATAGYMAIEIDPDSGSSDSVGIPWVPWYAVPIIGIIGGAIFGFLAFWFSGGLSKKRYRKPAAEPT